MKAWVFALATTAALALAGTAAAIHDENQRFVGGGWIENPNILDDPSARIRVGLEIPCGIEDPDIRPSLEVTWGGNQFHLSEVTLASCDGADGEGQIAGEGVGSCNGERAVVRFDLTAGARVSSVHQLALEGSAAGCALATGATALGGGTFRFIEDPDI